MSKRKILWISDYPVEHLPDAPAEARGLPRQHPLSWQRVLLKQLEGNPKIELHVAVLRKTIARDFDFERHGVVFHLLKAQAGLRAPSLFWTDTWRLRKLAREIRPDVVHAWGSEKGAAIVASRLGAPYLVTIQGLMRWYAELVPMNRYEKFAALLERISLPRAPLVSTEAAAAIDFLRAKYPRLPTVQIEHAPDPLFSKIVRTPQLAPLRLLFVGGLEYRKGGDLLLSALEQLAPELSFELVVAGSIHPTIAGQWEALRAGALAGRARLERDLSPAEVAAELARATCLVFPTRADTSPNAVKEAVVAGVPVVATRVGGIPEYVSHGSNGLLIRSGDLSGLVEAIREAAGHPLFSRGEVDPSALAASRAWLAAPLMAEKFLAAYERLAGVARAVV